MKRPFLGVVVFTLAVILALVGIAELVTRVSCEGGRSPAAALTSADITPEAGEVVFQDVARPGHALPNLVEVLEEQRPDFPFAALTKQKLHSPRHDITSAQGFTSPT